MEGRRAREGAGGVSCNPSAGGRERRDREERSDRAASANEKERGLTWGKVRGERSTLVLRRSQSRRGCSCGAEGGS